MRNSPKLRRGVVAGVATAGVAGIATAPLAGPVQAETNSGAGILHANSANSIEDSYIVVLKDTKRLSSASDAQAESIVDTTANGLASQYGAEVGETYSAALNGFSITADEVEATELAADENVDYVVQNQTHHVLDTQENPPSWGLDRVDQRDLPLDNGYTYETKAENVTAYVVDTGVLATRTTFEGRVQAGFDAIDGDDDATDEHGHGTHVAGTIGGAEYGLAKGVSIVAVRVLDADGSGTTEQVVAGINWVAEQAQTLDGPPVANMSLGGGVDEVLDEAVRGAVESGVTFTVAAGNSGADANDFSPARVEEAVTVAASDDQDGQADFSNYGDKVDLYAPGVDITSSVIGGDDASDTFSGTSMAAPHVAGAVALFLADNPEATPAEVAEAITSAATPDKITNPSEGTPNKLLYTGPVE